MRDAAEARESGFNEANAERQAQGEAVVYHVRLLKKQLRAEGWKVAAINAEVSNRFSIGRTRYYQIIKKQNL